MMTNKEAIMILESVQPSCEKNSYSESEIYEAIDMAIQALSEPERKNGKWIIVDDCELFIAKCSECGRIEDSRAVYKYPFCHCGADMRGE